MPTIKLPQSGKSMRSGTILRWTKRVGETVAKGEILVEVETEEGLLHVESPVAGGLGQILVPAGKTASAHEPLALIEDAAVVPAPAAPAPSPAAPPRPAERWFPSSCPRPDNPWRKGPS